MASDEHTNGKPISAPVSGLLAKILRNTAQASALIALIGFIVSVIANSIIFNDWRLNFLQVATPTDVVVSGFSIAIGMLPGIFTIIAGFFLAYFIEKTLSKYDKMNIARIAIAIIMIIELLVFSTLIGERFDYIDFGNDDEYNWHVRYLLILITSILYGYFIIDELSSNTPSLPVRLFLIIAVLLLIAISFLSYGVDVRDNSFLGQPMAARINGIELCEPNQVLWMGSENIIVRCTDQPDGPITILHRPDGLQLLPLDFEATSAEVREPTDQSGSADPAE